MALRTVIIGFGQIAAGLASDPAMAATFRYATHAQAVRDHAAFDWDAVVDPSEAARQSARESWNIRHAVATVADLRGFDAEVAVITAPPTVRVAAIEQLPSLRAVLIEKPLGPQGEEFLAACKRRNILVQVNFWRRADENMRQLVDGGLQQRIGQPQAVFGVYGNGLRNNGSHLVDLIRMLLGESGFAVATGPASIPHNAPIAGDLNVPFALHLANGAHAAATPLDFRHYREVGLDIWGTAGRLEILQEGFAVHAYPVRPNRGLSNAAEVTSEERKSIAPTGGMALYRMYDNLAAALADRSKRLWSDGESALQTERTLEAVLASVAGGGTRQMLPRAV